LLFYGFVLIFVTFVTSALPNTVFQFSFENMQFLQSVFEKNKKLNVLRKIVGGGDHHQKLAS